MLKYLRLRYYNVGMPWLFGTSTLQGKSPEAGPLKLKPN